METEKYSRWKSLSREQEAIASHLVTADLIREAFPKADIDSHKGKNGKVLVIGGSPLFHGAGRLAAIAASQITVETASRLNDMVYFCSTPENLKIIQNTQEAFIGIHRDQVNHYLPMADAVLAGPGLMREEDRHRPETVTEAETTLKLTRLVLNSGKRVVLDAGSLQVINKEELKNKTNVIITPHRGEMIKLFGGIESDYLVSQNANYSEVETVANRISKIAKDYGITILLKGPIDIIASPGGWLFSPGGNPGMSKGGTGDVLAGVVTAFYGRMDNPLAAAGAASFLLKRASESLEKDYDLFYNASDLARKIVFTLADTLR